MVTVYEIILNNIGTLTIPSGWEMQYNSVTGYFKFYRSTNARHRINMGKMLIITKSNYKNNEYHYFSCQNIMPTIDTF